MKTCFKILCFSALLLLSSCYVGYVSDVPPDQTVVRVEPPFAGAVWIDNEWRWDGTRYVVVPGHYEHPRGAWHRGTWVKTRRGYRWQKGRWH